MMAIRSLLVLTVALIASNRMSSEPPPSEPASSGPVEATSLLGVPLRAPVLPEDVRNDRERQLAEAAAAHAAHPDNEMAAIWHGRRLAYLGRYRDAIAVYSAALERHPDSYRLRRHRGHRYITVRRLDDAVTDLQRATELSCDAEDAIEPDGLPNARNDPRSTTKGNIAYHLALAHYLRGEFDDAARVARAGLALARNDDMRCAATYWLYLALHRAGRGDEAEAALEPIHREMDIIENWSYMRLLILYQSGTAGGATPQAFAPGSEAIDDATQAYGLAVWHLLRDDEELARKRFRAIVDASSPWSAFGYIAAEAELARGAN